VFAMNIQDEAQAIFDKWMDGDCATALLALEKHGGLLGHAICAQLVLLIIDADESNRTRGLTRISLPNFIEMIEEAAFDRRILEVGETMER